jgi:hypothetical protein
VRAKRGDHVGPDPVDRGKPGIQAPPTGRRAVRPAADRRVQRRQRARHHRQPCLPASPWDQAADRAAWGRLVEPLGRPSRTGIRCPRAGRYSGSRCLLVVAAQFPPALGGLPIRRATVPCALAATRYVLAMSSRPPSTTRLFTLPSNGVLALLACIATTAATHRVHGRRRRPGPVGPAPAPRTTRHPPQGRRAGRAARRAARLPGPVALPGVGGPGFGTGLPVTVQPSAVALATVLPSGLAARRGQRGRYRG